MTFTTQQMDNITTILNKQTSGFDENLMNDLMPLVYEEMKRIARRQLNYERANHTLNTTALVHEAYLKLSKFDRIDLKNKNHFFGIASHVMRNILASYAVKQNAIKRGGDHIKVTLSNVQLASEVNLEDILSIHQALEKLAKLDERQVRVIECRFFGGMTLDETAKALGVSDRTVSRDWEMARAWLNVELGITG